MKNEIRYIVTEAVSIPVYRIKGKGEAYRMATKDGWGYVCDFNGELICNEDSSVVLYPKYGQEYCMVGGDTFIAKEAPKQAETRAIITSGSHGYDIWAKDIADIKIFVTYDENGLIDTYRFEGWNCKQLYDGEIEITYDDLQSEAEHDATDRADITGTFEHSRKTEAPKVVEFFQTTKGHYAKVNGVVVWFIRDNPRLRSNEGWFVYKSEDGGQAFKLIPVDDERYGHNTLEAAKAFVYRKELAA